jgi:hypothetical protein
MDNAGDSELGLSGSVVMHFIDLLLDEGRTVYIWTVNTVPPDYILNCTKGAHE